MERCCQTEEDIRSSGYLSWGGQDPEKSQFAQDGSRFQVSGDAVASGRGVAFFHSCSAADTARQRCCWYAHGIETSRLQRYIGRRDHIVRAGAGQCHQQMFWHLLQSVHRSRIELEGILPHLLLSRRRLTHSRVLFLDYSWTRLSKKVTVFWQSKFSPSIRLKMGDPSRWTAPIVEHLYPTGKHSHFSCHIHILLLCSSSSVYRFLIFNRSNRCFECHHRFPSCIATGAPLFDTSSTWSCRICKHSAVEEAVTSRKSCPLCHAAL